MSSGAVLIETQEKPTGESLQAWLNQELSDCRTGESKSINIVYRNLSNLRTADSPQILTCSLPPTDLSAAEFARETYFAEWSRNLSQLSAVARQIIPGLRNLTSSERNSLHQYYRRLYRKP